MAKKETVSPPESEYTIDEFAKSFTIFGDDVSPDIVTAALKAAGVTQTTKNAAAAIINNYKKKEVR